MPSPLPLLRFLVLWLPALVQAHTLQLESCHTDRIILQPWLQVHEDDRGDYTLNDLLDVVSTESGAVDLSHLRPGLASAALWLRFEVINAASEDCRMWLFPAAPRARDMRLFEQHQGQWQQRQAGADWPLAQWDAPLRLPAFELYLPSGQSRVFILRMGNWPPVGMQPMLLSHDGLLRTRATLWPLVPLSLLSSKEFAMPMPFIAEPQSHFYHSRGLRLHYLDWGNPDAPTLILIHGGLEHARVWDQLAQQLCDDWHVVVPDLRGHGDSDWSTGGAYAIPDFVPDIAALVAALGDRSVTLVAHSLGGNIAIHYTALFPENVSRLCVIEGLGSSPEARAKRDAKPRREQLREWVERVRELDRLGPSQYQDLEAAVQRLMEHDPLLSRELAEYVCQRGLKPNEDGQLRWKYDHLVRGFGPAEVASVEPSDLWRAIECPVLLMYGAQSWASNPEKDGRSAHFSQARVVVVEKAGHNLHHHRPEVFMAHLREFLG